MFINYKKPLFLKQSVKNSSTSGLALFRSLKEIVGILCMLHYSGFLKQKKGQPKLPFVVSKMN